MVVTLRVDNRLFDTKAFIEVVEDLAHVESCRHLVALRRQSAFLILRIEGWQGVVVGVEGAADKLACVRLGLPRDESLLELVG